MNCVECGSDKLEPKVIKHVTQVGRYSVEDGSTPVTVCLACGSPNFTMGDLKGFELRAAKYIFSGSLELIGGAEFRDARKAMGLRQVDLAGPLNRDVATISKYENDKDALPNDVKLVMAALLDRFIRDGKDGLELNKATSHSGELRIAC
jgi:DNA-binding XRE family transcriptional regulator